MAVRHGLAGQYPKSRAQRLHNRYLVVLTAAAMIVGCLVGILISGAFSNVRWTLGIVLASTIILLTYVARKKFVTFIDELAKERIKYMRGGQAEALVAWILEDLPSHYHVFNGLKIERESDIDHIVVGPQGLYCISTKADRGHFEMREGELYRNGERCSHARQVLSQARALAERLAALRGKPAPWVQAVLAVPFGFVAGPTRSGKIWIVHQDNLLDTLHPLDAPPRLDKSEIKALEHSLKLLLQDTAMVRA